MLDPDDLDSWRAKIGALGIWCSTEPLAASEAAALAADAEAWGYGTLWTPETLGRDPFVLSALLATRTTSLVMATGIASIYHRLPGPMRQAADSVAELSGGRFVLGLGVSHQPMVEGIHKVAYERPVAKMRNYVEQVDASPYLAVAPPGPVPRVLAALGPKMLALCAEVADGALTYWGTPAHTATARGVLGTGKLLCVEQKVVLTEDREVARATAAGALDLYAALPNYRNNWLRLGFDDDQIDGRDPAFIDALVAHGTPEQLRERIEAHHRAGADHVCIQPLTPGNPFLVDRAAVDALAPGAS